MSKIFRPKNVRSSVVAHHRHKPEDDPKTHLQLVEERIQHCYVIRKEESILIKDDDGSDDDCIGCGYQYLKPDGETWTDDPLLSQRFEFHSIAQRIAARQTPRIVEVVTLERAIEEHK